MIKFKLLLCCIVVFSTFTAIAQNLIVAGKVINSQNRQGIPFATLGIKDKNIGTVTDESGAFQFSIPAGQLNETEQIVVTSVGYQASLVLTNSFKQGKQTIELIPTNTALKAVNIKPARVKEKVYGRTGNSTIMVATMYTQKQLIDDNLGKEQASILNIDNDCYLKDFNIYVVFNRFKNVKFRLNFYSVKNGTPDSLISNQNILFDVTKPRGWVKVDLTPYQIYLTGYKKIAVAIQWLKSEKADSASHAFSVSATFSPTHATFFRDKSQAQWNKVSNAYVAYNITADYFKPRKDNNTEVAEDKEENAALTDSLKELVRYTKYTEAATSSPYGDNVTAGKYLHLPNSKLYFEVYGKGEPLLLLHGNSQSISSFYQQIKTFTKHYQVIAVDTRAQGKSTDSLNHDLTYELFAADMKLLLDSLHLKKLNVLGWSDGGITALIMGFKYPNYVNKLAVMGANLFPEGIEVKMLNSLQKQYAETKNFVDPGSVNRKRLINLLLTQPHITFEELKQIKAPVLVMAGEHDLILPEHTHAIQQHLSNSKLVIFKDASHSAPWEIPQAFNEAVVSFFK